MLLKEFLEKRETVEVVRRANYLGKVFNNKYDKLVNEIEETICKEMPISKKEFENLPKDTHFISHKIKRLYEKFNQLLNEELKNLRTMAVQ